MEQYVPAISLAVLICVHFAHSVWRFGLIAGEQLALRRDFERLSGIVNGTVNAETLEAINAAQAEIREHMEREIFSRFERHGDRFVRVEERIEAIGNRWAGDKG